MLNGLESDGVAIDMVVIDGNFETGAEKSNIAIVPVKGL
jgi:hypothetical protein